jgi:hypothetical protein
MGMGVSFSCLYMVDLAFVTSNLPAAMAGSHVSEVNAV